jgi:uncharacterized protein involved in response to NO
MASLLRVEEPPRAPEQRFALFALGFRPFYLLASAFAALSIPLWALQFSGLLPRPYLSGPLWHAHEMLFGFTLAVIVGFLFTAGRNWTDQPTPTGWKLASLAALAAAIALAIPFVKAKNKRNYFFVGLLVLLAIAAAFIHLSHLGLASAPAWLGVQIALDVVLFILCVMGGRVIPMFTNNGVPGADATRRPHVEKAALASVLALLATDAVGLNGWPLSLVAIVACVAHAWRWALWQPWKTRRAPLVWVLHLAYLWIPVHLLLRAFGELGLVTPSLATHALTVGAVGGLVIGMMTRTARGHTARPLRADRCETTCYVLVLLAALARVAVPLVAPEQTVHAVLASAALWSAGFGLYAVRYWPVLSRPRLDGRPG